jgi:hypothetical protein
MESSNEIEYFREIHRTDPNLFWDMFEEILERSSREKNGFYSEISPELFEEYRKKNREEEIEETWEGLMKER